MQLLELRPCGVRENEKKVHELNIFSSLIFRAPVWSSIHDMYEE